MLVVTMQEISCRTAARTLVCMEDESCISTLVSHPGWVQQKAEGGSCLTQAQIRIHASTSVLVRFFQFICNFGNQGSSDLFAIWVSKGAVICKLSNLISCCCKMRFVLDISSSGSLIRALVFAGTGTRSGCFSRSGSGMGREHAP